ncbi:MAG TPA: anaerobic ribonucleoside-triphosphate reductase activating protein [Clostridiales bacterium]|nr:anaerobic ribonucleoside-triphosphate reductase activating protein [Clostridiales bacterium]
MHIHGFNKTTLLDYPKHLAATIFIGGCNLRCPFCHNASLVTNVNSQPIIPTNEVLAVLKKRKDILEGVCITGGEPTIYSDLPEFINDIKKLGLKVKLDTNGSNPSMIKSLIHNNLIDYIAMDIKNSKDKYSLSVGVDNYLINNTSESINFILQGLIDYEFRTTIVKELHSEIDMIAIGEWIKGANAYYLQAFVDSGDLISNGLTAHSKEEMSHFSSLLKPYVKSVFLRGL